MKTIRLVILGPQASGKGTQAELLSKKFKIPHLATGDLFRQEIAAKTKRGKYIASIIDRGKMMPNKITNQMMAERLAKKDCKRGFIVDGYPRNKGQFSALEKMAKLDAVILIHISDKEAVRRLAGRRSCLCGRVYHIKYSPPKKNGYCDKCSRKLYIRVDDKPVAIRQRLKIYHQRTEPPLKLYQQKGILVKINGQQAIKAVHQEIMRKLKIKNC